MTPTDTLSRRLQNAMLDMLPVGTRVDEIEIMSARGYWTHVQQDVMPWQGRVRLHPAGSRRWFDCSIGSWDTITTLVRKGFIIEDQRGHDRTYVDFEVHRMSDTPEYTIEETAAATYAVLCNGKKLAEFGMRAAAEKYMAKRKAEDPRLNQP